MAKILYISFLMLPPYSPELDPSEAREMV